LKHWQETGQIVERLIRISRDGRRCALATVTRIVGSAYRRPGAKLLIEDGGAVHGGVSGGCLEEDVRQIGRRVMESGQARLRHYATGDDEDKVWGLGLGCNGEVDILVQPVAPEAAGAWEAVGGLLAGDAPFALACPLEDGAPGGVTVVVESGRRAGTADPAIEAAAHDALRARRSGWTRAGERALFVEVLTPPPSLVVCGAGDDARPLAAFAAAAGFRVIVADHRPAYLTAARFPEARARLPIRPTDEAALPGGRDAYAVVMTHSLDRDTEWVRRLLTTEAPYIGLLGPRVRTEGILEKLGASGSDRVFGPVGLDLGADGPEQVAISIVSELLSVWSGRELRHLRERETAVHADR
jgi:xanthine/CO dehydrogenase XdhC/CoxF family maturation factor